MDSWLNHMANQKEILKLLVYFLFAFSCAIPLGLYMAKMLDQGQESKNFLEKFIFKFWKIENEKPMLWSEYASSLIIFNLVGLFVLFFILKFQHFLPSWSSTDQPQTLSFWLALNTAISFVTNTNWQAYAGEEQLHFITQAFGLTVQNFLSAGTGLSVAVVLIRGLRQKENPHLGNFWVDLIRALLYILLPLSLLLGVLLMKEGVIQNFESFKKVKTLEGKEQILPQGPVASQVAIRQIGGNGGGYMGANSAHPFENPTPLSNFWQMLAILLLPLSTFFMFGKMVKSQRNTSSLLMAIGLLYFSLLALALWSEHQRNPFYFHLPFMDGKEARFGITESILWGVTSTATANGSVNALHTSFSPLAGLVCLLNMMLGEVLFGGVGSGFYGIVMFSLLTVFLCGLMIGRTPEYFGKKLEIKEIQWALVAILGPGLFILIFSALALSTQMGLAGISQSGPHGFSEVLYAFSSALGNNGSSFSSLKADSIFYHVLTGLGMLIGRFLVMISVLIIAGGLASKRIVPPSMGTFPTTHILFSLLLASIILIVGALTFFPALLLGPYAEHLLLYLH